MQTNAATKSAVVAIALVGTVAAFAIGAQAGAILNGRVMGMSVARVPMPIANSPVGSPVNGHGR
jgi:hypothetical protein